MDHNFSCEYKRVILKPLSRNEIEPLRQLRNRPEIRKWFLYSEVISQEEQVQWYEKYIGNPTDFMYAVYLKKAPAIFVGAYAHYNYDKESRIIEGGRLMVDSGTIDERGIGRDIICGATKLAFQNLDIDLIKAEVFVKNERSMRCHMNGAGFYVAGKRLEKNNEKIALLELDKISFWNFLEKSH